MSERLACSGVDNRFVAYFLVTLKFDAQGNWKIVKTLRVSSKHNDTVFPFFGMSSEQTAGC